MIRNQRKNRKEGSLRRGVSWSQDIASQKANGHWEKD